MCLNGLKCSQNDGKMHSGSTKFQIFNSFLVVFFGRKGDQYFWNGVNSAKFGQERHKRHTGGTKSSILFLMKLSAINACMNCLCWVL